jgi:hypothetical protein
MIRAKRLGYKIAGSSEASEARLVSRLQIGLGNTKELEVAKRLIKKAHESTLSPVELRRFAKIIQTSEGRRRKKNATKVAFYALGYPVEGAHSQKSKKALRSYGNKVKNKRASGFVRIHPPSGGLAFDVGRLDGIAFAYVSNFFTGLGVSLKTVKSGMASGQGAAWSYYPKGKIRGDIDRQRSSKTGVLAEVEKSLYADKLLTADQIAEKVKISKRRLLRFRSEGRAFAIRQGASWMFPESQVFGESLLSGLQGVLRITADLEPGHVYQIIFSPKPPTNSRPVDLLRAGKTAAAVASVLASRPALPSPSDKVKAILAAVESDVSSDLGTDDD